MQNDEAFVAWACSTACSLIAGLSWDDPQVLLARSAFEAGRAAEREALTTMPRLMHACDAVDVPANGEYAALLRASLCGA